MRHSGRQGGYCRRIQNMVLRSALPPQPPPARPRGSMLQRSGMPGTPRRTRVTLCPTGNAAMPRPKSQRGMRDEIALYPEKRKARRWARPFLCGGSLPLPHKPLKRPPNPLSATPRLEIYLSGGRGRFFRAPRRLRLAAGANISALPPSAYMGALRPPKPPGGFSAAARALRARTGLA